MSDEPLTDKPDPFVVKITNPAGYTYWLTSPDLDGSRTLSTRERAAVFPTEAGARVAIAKMPQTFKEAGLTFSIESDQ